MTETMKSLMSLIMKMPLEMTLIMMTVTVDFHYHCCFHSLLMHACSSIGVHSHLLLGKVDWNLQPCLFSNSAMLDLQTHVSSFRYTVDKTTGPFEDDLRCHPDIAGDTPSCSSLDRIAEGDFQSVQSDSENIFCIASCQYSNTRVHSQSKLRCDFLLVRCRLWNGLIWKNHRLQ